MSSLFVRTKEITQGVWNTGQERWRLVRTKGKREGIQRIWEGVGRVRKRPPKEGMLFNNPQLEEGDRVILWESKKNIVTH
jgi:hypothetical protein